MTKVGCDSNQIVGTHFFPCNFILHHIPHSPHLDQCLTNKLKCQVQMTLIYSPLSTNMSQWKKQFTIYKHKIKFVQMYFNILHVKKLLQIKGLSLITTKYKMTISVDWNALNHCLPVIKLHTSRHNLWNTDHPIFLLLLSLANTWSSHEQIFLWHFLQMKIFE